MNDDDITHPDHPLQVGWRKWVRPYVQKSTEELRSSPLRRYKQLRDRLQNEGVRPVDAALADLHEEDGHLEFGIIAAGDSRGFLFEFRYDRDANEVELTSPDDAWVCRWEELDEVGLHTYRRPLQVARSILAEERSERCER